MPFLLWFKDMRWWFLIVGIVVAAYMGLVPKDTSMLHWLQDTLKEVKGQ